MCGSGDYTRSKRRRRRRHDGMNTAAIRNGPAMKETVGCARQINGFVSLQSAACGEYEYQCAASREREVHH